ncbi:MFS transporter [Tengunoibacter tsumagoiensis]|uniref:MFS transporter n=1 Tax=Tengunoibacter tsumagoiensis TaxID=2014871 RepID=A0A402A4E5_9CHLR|nr:MFS transporter [Tengunoibacter tsumagoiensis]GCE13982.1 MFS transporter [Tengunoibacter tsumagoiensis]
MAHVNSYFQQFGRFQRSARLYLISNALSGISAGIITVLYNLYLAQLGYGADFIGLVLLIATIGGGLMIFPAGLCIDRFGGKLILIWSSVLVGLAGTGQILFRTPLTLCISGFIAGIGGAFLLVINAPFLSTHSTSEERPHLFSLNIVLSLGTTVLGEFIGGFLPGWIRNFPTLMAPLPTGLEWLLASGATARSYQLSLLLAGLISLPSFIPLFLMASDRPATIPRSLQVPVSFHSQLQQRMTQLAKIRQRWRPLLKSPFATMLLAQILLYCGAGLFIPYFNLYFVQHLGASPALFGALDGGANLLHACMILMAPWLALRIGQVASIVIPRVLALPLMLILGFTRSLPLAAIAYPLRQGLTDMSQGIFQVFSMEVVEPRHRGLANSSYQAAYQVSYALATPIGGLIITHVGYAPLFVIACLLYSLMLILFWVRFGHRSH